jgi:hypothetical protein
VATYFTDDFADFSTDWTTRIKTGSTDFAVSGGDLSLGIPGASDWTYKTWNDVDGDSGRADFDVLILYNSSSFSQRNHVIIGRGAGADESATNYSIGLAPASIRTYVCNAADTPVQISTTTISISTGNDYWIRFRVNGSAVKAKIWIGLASDEPGGVASDSNWDCSGTDSTVSAAGWVGVAAYGTTAMQGTVKQIGIGTNGDWGPSSAGGGYTHPTLSNVTATEITATSFKPRVTYTF